MPKFDFDSQSAGQQRSLPAAKRATARMLVVAGGRVGVGSTTLALHLAHELAAEAQRIVLIDADLPRPGIASSCRLPAAMTISDVLAGQRTIHEALSRGPAGMQVLAAAADGKTNPDERSITRFFKQLSSLSPHADWLIVDTGPQATALAARFWAAADQLLLVTASDAVAVMDAYALVKTMQARKALEHPPALVVNRIEDPLLAADVHRRIDQSCRRFLALSVPLAAVLPVDPSATLAEPDREGPLAASVARLCKQLAADPRLPASPRAA